MLIETNVSYIGSKLYHLLEAMLKNEYLLNLFYGGNKTTR
jgi:hypothetical protein